MPVARWPVAKDAVEHYDIPYSLESLLPKLRQEKTRLLTEGIEPLPDFWAHLKRMVTYGGDTRELGDKLIITMAE